MATFTIGGNWEYTESFSAGTLAVPMTGNFAAYSPAGSLNATAGDFDITATNAISLSCTASNITLSPAGGSVVLNGINAYMQPSIAANIISPDVLINNTAAVGNTRLGNIFAGNVLSLESQDIQIPNNPTITSAGLQWAATGVVGFTSTTAGGGIALISSQFLTFTADAASVWTMNDTLLLSATNTLTLGSTAGQVNVTGDTNIVIRTITGEIQIIGVAGTKLILPTPAGANNTPLLIDTDGTLHV